MKSTTYTIVATQETPNEWKATCRELGVFGWGETEGEAVNECRWQIKFTVLRSKKAQAVETASNGTVHTYTITEE